MTIKKDKGSTKVTVAIITSIASIIVAIIAVIPQLMDPQHVDPPGSTTTINKTIDNNGDNGITNNIIIHTNPDPVLPSPKITQDRRSDGIKIHQYSKYVGVRNNSQWWNWGVYLAADRATLSNINCVTYYLHPTFKPSSYRTCNNSNNFRMDSNGWGEFNINIKVENKDGSSKFLSHYLTLDRLD